MALIEERRRPSPFSVRILPTLGAVVVCSFFFVFFVGVIARCTADSAVMPVPVVPVVPVVGDVVDAGVVGVAAGFVDAGSEDVDAGVLVTVSLDAGQEPTLPATVSGPPFEAKEVAAAAAVVVEVCAREALRWDPSLGGPFTLIVNLPEGAPAEIVVDGLVSPILSSCLARRITDLTLPEAARAPLVSLAVSARASLDGAARVTWSDPAVTALEKKMNGARGPE